MAHNITHNIVLEGLSGERYGLRVISEQVKEIPMSFPVARFCETCLVLGDHKAEYSHIKQVPWVDGRGHAKSVLD